MGQKLPAIDAGEVQIEEDEVGWNIAIIATFRVGVEPGESLLAVMSYHKFMREASFFKSSADKKDVTVIIFSQQNSSFP
jgi:hypothetical protein